MRRLSIKKRELLYCLSGTAFAAALFLSILSLRYENIITAKSNNLDVAGHKSRAMKKAVKDMKALVERLETGKNVSARRPREALLASLDEIKTRFKASNFSVSDFNKRGDALRIGVEIEIPLNDYAAFVKNLHYLESMSLPWFTTQNVEISGDEDGYMAKVKGEAVMPVDDGLEK